jgi:hypothetical protein
MYRGIIPKWPEDSGLQRLAKSIMRLVRQKRKELEDN